MYYKIAVAKITNFVRGTCKGIHFSSSSFTIPIYSFPKYWIPLQIVPSFQEHLFHRLLHNDCFQIWLPLKWGWLNPWYSKKGWLFLYLFSLFYIFCSWKNFRVWKVVMGNILADPKDFYIFTFISIIRFGRRFIAWNKFS